jgi:hypothetical protein
MHTCSRLKLNEAVDFDDQGREDIRNLALMIRKTIMNTTTFNIATSIYKVTIIR